MWKNFNKERPVNQEIVVIRYRGELYLVTYLKTAYISCWVDKKDNYVCDCDNTKWLKIPL
jgi:hypothetical protein